MKKIYYGWYVCAASTLLIFVTMGTVSNGFSVFLPYIKSIHGFTHAQTSHLITIRCLVALLSMLSIKFYYKKFSIRVGTVIAAVCAGIAFCIYSAAESYLTFCIGAAISGLSYGLGSMIPVSILMNKWFIEHRALAISICACGSGIATVVLPPVTTFLVESFSMKAAFGIEAVAIFIIDAVILLVLRNSPEEKKLMPYGYEENAASETKEHRGHSYGLNRKMWIFMGCTSLFMGALANPGFSHLSVLYTTEGYSPSVVAAIISGVGIMLALGKVICGQITDKIGGFKSSALFSIMLFIGNVLCCLSFTKSVGLCIATVPLLGMGYAIATVGPPVWASDLVSPDRYADTVRKFQIIYATGAFVFASVPGILADIFGDYIPAYMLFAACTAMAFIFIVLTYKKDRENSA